MYIYIYSMQKRAVTFVERLSYAEPQKSLGQHDQRGDDQLLQKLEPSKVWPKPQLGGATLLDTATDPSLVTALKEMAWPCILLLPVNCHIWPQLRFKGCQLVLDPFMYSCWTSPAPPTLVTSTSKK